jgi:DNA-nicking Smr family endonuclease
MKDVPRQSQPKTPKPASPQPRPKRASPEARTRELAARKRVAALVSGGLHFKIKREGERIQGQRGGGSPKVVARLTSKGFWPEVTLDLRGQPLANARDLIASFLSGHHRRGVQQLAIVFDLEAGADQARDAIVTALTLGPAAALVRAFATAREDLGGNAALAVLLI